MYRILIVEDDKGIADAIKVQAQMWDLQVLCVQNFRNVMNEQLYQKISDTLTVLATGGDRA